MSIEQDLGRLEGKVDRIIDSQDKLTEWLSKHQESDKKAFGDVQTAFQELRNDIGSIKIKAGIFGGIAIFIIESAKYIYTAWSQK
jgi:hypothetical protein